MNPRKSERKGYKLDAKILPRKFDHKREFLHKWSSTTIEYEKYFFLTFSEKM